MYFISTTCWDFWASIWLILKLIACIFFSGKPLTPNITGSLNISVGNISQMFCLSKPTSSPNYYAQLVNLSYMWFVNGTKLDKEMGQSIELNVTKDHKYNNYTCTSRDNQLESDRSHPVQINPLCEVKLFKSTSWYFK